MRLTHLLIVSLAILCAGCGGGGGASGNVIVVGGPQLIIFPQNTVTIQKTAGRVAPGETMALRLTVAGTQPATLEVLIGNDWSTATQQGVSPSGTGAWAATVIYSNPLPPAGSILVRLIMTDGEIFESSLYDIVDDSL